MACLRGRQTGKEEKMVLFVQSKKRSGFSRSQAVGAALYPPVDLVIAPLDFGAHGGSEPPLGRSCHAVGCRRPSVIPSLFSTHLQALSCTLCWDRRCIVCSRAKAFGPLSVPRSTSTC